MRHLLAILAIVSVLDAHIELDQCLAAARANVLETEEDWDDQPTAEYCFELYRDRIDGN